MTKQDKSANWAIKIGGGFEAPNRKVYPQDRLEKFLNFIPKSEQEAAIFCTANQIIPPELFLPKSNIIRILKKEQSKMHPIAQKIAAGLELNVEDWDLINLNLGHIRKSKNILTSDEIDKLNHVSSGEVELIPPGNYPIDTFTHDNTIASLWADLARRVDSSLMRCIGCGAFYKAISKHNRKYCTINCGNKTRLKKFRAKK